MMKMVFPLAVVLCLLPFLAVAQVQPTDSVSLPVPDSTIMVVTRDTSLRIMNINPYFSVHVDSSLTYPLQVNRSGGKYYWYLNQQPVGLKINKDNGLLSFKADKAFFLSGKLQYDHEYTVQLSVRSLDNAAEKYDTSFRMLFYNTEVIPSRLNTGMLNSVTIDEGEAVEFRLQCETGSFPIEHVSFFSSALINGYTAVRQCNDLFSWTPGYDFVNAGQTKEAQRTVVLTFIGTTRFGLRDTATVKVVVKDALNYPMALLEYELTTKKVRTYVLQLKYIFLQLDKAVRRTKRSRNGFDLTSSATSLSGTILGTSSSTSTQNIGTIMPSVGVALVPIKEAAAPTKTTEQNQATLIRSSVKRLEYMLNDNQLVGEKDSDISKKTAKLKEELKQIQTQLLEIPSEMVSDMSEKELNDYFNSPRVNKKYRLGK